MKILSFVLLAVLSVSLSAKEVVSGPDGRLSVSLELSSGKLSFAIEYDGKTILQPSPLGLETSVGSFASELTLLGYETGEVEESYELPHGKVSSVEYRANELVGSYRNATGDELRVVFRVSDNDVAFSYRVSSPDKLRIVVEKEATGFDFPTDATAFLSQQAAPGSGWKMSKPSYEEGYLMDVPVGTPSPTGVGFTFPGLFRFGDRAWALISETGVSSKYVASKLGNPTEDGLYPLAFPEPGENGGIGEATVIASLPMESPWRTITVGESLALIVESTVATDVVEPLYEPSVDYQTGIAAWSWLLWQDGSMNEADQRTFIDLAGEMGFEYILIDALWDENLGREKLAELVAYANSKDVDALVWYNSNGYWNDAPQGPRNRMDSAPARQEEMAWLQSIGVKGLKVDFFGGDKQATMKLYEDILTDGNRYGLSMNFHGATLPRGWERMYPNHMTSEAVTASENLIFTQDFADKEAFNSTVFPFVRNPVAAMDYGPVLLNKRFSKDPDRGNIRRTTDAFQLATAVLFFSPIQHLGLTPNNLEEQPDYVIDFLKTLPAAWDETRFIDGYPGEFVALARRHGDRWYVAATHSGKEKRELTLVLPWLEEGQSFQAICDGEDGAAVQKRLQAGTGGQLEVTLGPEGGVALVQE